MQVISSVVQASHEAALPPFASYAQLVRKLMPLVRKVVFTDAQGKAIWSSDGIEEAELTLQVQLLFTRLVQTHAGQHAATTHSDLPEPVHVFPVRDDRGLLVGALTVLFRELPEAAAYRQYDTVLRVLNPLLDILQHGWQPAMPAMEPTIEPIIEARLAPSIEPIAAVMQEPDAAPVPQPTAEVVIEIPPVQPAMATAPPVANAKTVVAAGSSLPAILRRVLIEAADVVPSAFGTIVLPGNTFVLSHRVAADESDLNVSAAVDAVRSQLLRWMTVRNEPLIVNANDRSQSQFSSYKFLAWPIRAHNGPLLALLVLFRHRLSQDFNTRDLNRLTQVTAQVPIAALAHLKPTPAPAPLELHHHESQVAARTPTDELKINHSESPPSTPTTPATRAVQRADDSATGNHAQPYVSMQELVRIALGADAFELHAQRISPLRGPQSIERFEVLLRLPDEQVLHTPAAFLAAAEAENLMSALDRWVIRQLLRTLRNSDARQQRREFCVNLSVASLLDDRFRELLIAEIFKSKIQPGQLLFEVAEKVAATHQHALQTLGMRLRDVGLSHCTR